MNEAGAKKYLLELMQQAISGDPRYREIARMSSLLADLETARDFFSAEWENTSVVIGTRLTAEWRRGDYRAAITHVEHGRGCGYVFTMYNGHRIMFATESAETFLGVFFSLSLLCEYKMRDGYEEALKGVKL